MVLKRDTRGIGMKTSCCRLKRRNPGFSVSSKRRRMMLRIVPKGTYEDALVFFLVLAWLKNQDSDRSGALLESCSLLFR